MRHHVLRNALVPTVAVIAVQIGYLFGGIIAVEKIFNYNGMGATMLFAAQRKDIPMLTAGVIIIGIVYMLATLAADIIMAWMNPRIRLDAEQLMDVIVKPGAAGPDGRSGRVGTLPGTPRDAASCSSGARRSSSATSSSSAGSSAPSSASGSRPYDPFNYFTPGHLPPSPEHWMGTDRLGRDVLSRVMVGSRDVLIVAPLAALLGVAAGTLLGLVMGYYRGTRRRRPEPARRGVPRAARSSSSRC